MSVASIAALKTLGSRYQQGVARTRGYYAANDGGGGPDWQWEASNTTAPDDVLIVRPDNISGSNPGRWVRMWDGAYMSVLWAGAVGDAGPMTSTGATGTDDTLRLQAAIDAAGECCEIDFHDRRYRTGRLYVKHNASSFIGRGAALVSDLGMNNTGGATAVYTIFTDSVTPSLTNATPLDSAITEGQTTITLSTANAALFQVGDLLVVTTSKTMQYVGVYNLGSIRTVRAVNTSTGVITLDGGIENALNVATDTVRVTGYHPHRDLLFEGLTFEVTPNYWQCAMSVNWTDGIEIRRCNFLGGEGSLKSMIACTVTGNNAKFYQNFCQDWIDGYIGDENYNHFGYGYAATGHNHRAYNNDFARCKHALTGGGGPYVSSRLHWYANYAQDCGTAAYDIHANCNYAKIEDNYYLEQGKSAFGFTTTSYLSGIYARCSNIEVRRNVIVGSAAPVNDSVTGGVGVGDGAWNNVAIEDNLFVGVLGGVSIDTDVDAPVPTNIRICGNTYIRQTVPTPMMANPPGLLRCDRGITNSEISDNYIDSNGMGMIISGCEKTKITGNRIVYGQTSTTHPTWGPSTGIYLMANAAQTWMGANISDNTISPAAALSAQTLTAPVRIRANHNDVIVSGNVFDMTNSPNSSTVRYDEATALTRMVRKENIGDKFTAQSITAAGTTILPFGDIVVLTSTAAFTLSNTPIIPDGFDGQQIVLFNNGANNIVIRDQGTLANSNLRLTATSVTLGARDSVQLRYSSAVGDWVQVGALVNVL